MSPRPFATLALAAVFAGGCAAQDNSSIQPVAICAMPDDGTFTDECDAQWIGPLMLDVAYATDMWLALEMHNHLRNNADAGQGRLNTHDAHFESYSLEYSGLAPGIDPGVITAIAASGGRTQQLIPAEGTSVVGFEPFPVGVVNAIRTAGAPAGPDYDEVLVTVTLRGRFEDGADWEVPYTIPVRLCADCISIACEDPTQIPVGAVPSLYQHPRGDIVCIAPPTP